MGIVMGIILYFKKSTSEQHTATNLVDSFICPC